MTVDLSPEAVARRLRQVGQLRRLCLSLAHAGGHWPELERAGLERVTRPDGTVRIVEKKRETGNAPADDLRSQS